MLTIILSAIGGASALGLFVRFGPKKGILGKARATINGGGGPEPRK
jgi:hypothetical protein